jgi:hypothetical protein
MGNSFRSIVYPNDITGTSTDPRIYTIKCLGREFTPQQRYNNYLSLFNLIKNRDENYTDIREIRFESIQQDNISLFSALDESELKWRSIMRPNNSTNNTHYDIIHLLDHPTRDIPNTRF